MTSLDPFFRLLVRTLSEQVPPRIHRPIVINELMDSILPYRLVRRELGVDSAEEYETLLLRLCAGEGDFVQADPAAQAALLAELEKPLPDLAFLRVYGDTRIVLRTDPLLSAMEAHPEKRYAPPGAEPGPENEQATAGHEDDAGPDAWEADPVVELRAGAPPQSEPKPQPVTESADAGKPQVRCPFCGGILPPRMMINFCPHCGMGQDVGACRVCGADMDVGWRYCVSCGEDAQGGAS